MNIAICMADDSARQESKYIYLTFDDGPSDKVTPKILDVLDEEGVKATFFIIGQQAETRQAIVRRAFYSGHTMAVHSYNHVYNQIYSSSQSLLEDIDKCNNVLQSIIGCRSYIYRFPGGSYGLSKQLIDAVTSNGYRYVDWNASLMDAEIWQPTPKQLFDAAVTTSSDLNNIVLLAHDSTTKISTYYALRDIIKYFKSKGYIFETF
jgi:peptidoglycan/xylan/chitin deacetylase (PgdA/CDA1 family)